MFKEVANAAIWIGSYWRGLSVSSKRLGITNALVMTQSPQWYVGQLKPNGLAIAEYHLAQQRIETFCPWQIETTKRNGRLQDIKRSLFPGYIFLRFPPDARHWRSINATRGLTRLVQFDQRAPTPLPDQLISVLKARCDDNGKLIHTEMLKRGDQARIISGPFAECVIQIEQITADARIRVLFDLMKRKVIADLNPEQIRKIC